MNPCSPVRASVGPARHLPSISTANSLGAPLVAQRDSAAGNMTIDATTVLTAAQAAQSAPCIRRRREEGAGASSLTCGVDLGDDELRRRGLIGHSLGRRANGGDLASAARG